MSNPSPDICAALTTLVMISYYISLFNEKGATGGCNAIFMKGQRELKHLPKLWNSLPICILLCENEGAQKHSNSFDASLLAQFVAELSSTASRLCQLQAPSCQALETWKPINHLVHRLDLLDVRIPSFCILVPSRSFRILATCSFNREASIVGEARNFLRHENDRPSTKCPMNSKGLPVHSLHFACLQEALQKALSCLLGKHRKDS